MTTRANRLLTLLSVAVLACFGGCDDRAADDGSGDMPTYVYDFCIDYFTHTCETLFECAPAMAAVAFSVDSAAGCPSAAKSECQSDDGEDDCEPVWPSQGALDACLADSRAWSCTDYLDTPDGPASCQAISEPCPEAEPDQGGGGPALDFGVPADGAPPVSDCPYAAESFSCAAACDNLWSAAQTCADDPTLPSNLKLVFQAMTNVSQAKGLLACKAACAADSPSYPAQWSCFQAAPTDTCTALAGCTWVNCP